MIIDYRRNSLITDFDNETIFNFSKFEGRGKSVFLIGDVFSIDGRTISNENFVKTLEQCNDDLYERVDGYYVAIIVEGNDFKVITDRYSLLPIYYYVLDGRVVISNSMESIVYILKKDNVKLDLDQDSINFYIKKNSFPYNRTLYENIKRANPASIFNSKKLKNDFISRYWSWNKISEEDVSFENAVDKLHQLLLSSLEARVDEGQKVSLTLSGGLDSRLLLALSLDLNLNVKCFTFGKPDSPDVLIAQECCQRVGVSHQVISINESNWFHGREDAVFRTGGMANILHLHAVAPMNTIVEHSNIVLNGFLGDLILGGGYLKKKLNQKNMNSNDILNEKYGDLTDLIDLDDSYYNLNISDSYMIHNRGVRFTSLGSDAVSDKVLNIKPFLDNKLVEFIYSLPNDFRYGGRLYNAMLLKYYPNLFEDIVWQKTGEPISLAKNGLEQVKKDVLSSLISLISNSKLNKSARKVYSLLNPLKVNNMKSFVDYDSWTSTDSFKNYIDDLLFSEDCKLGSVFDVEDLLGSGDNLQKLGCLISLELFLKKVDS